MNMKRYLTTLIALVAMATGAWAATDYGFSLSGIPITSDNLTLHTGGSYIYDPVNNVLHITHTNGKYVIVDGDVNPNLNISIDADIEGTSFEDNLAHLHLHKWLRFNGSGHHVISGTGSIHFTTFRQGASLSETNNPIYVGTSHVTIKDIDIYINAINGYGFWVKSGGSLTFNHCNVKIVTGEGYAINSETGCSLSLKYSQLREGTIEEGSFVDHIDIVKTAPRIPVDVFNVTVQKPVIGQTVGNATAEVDCPQYCSAEVKWRKINSSTSYTPLNNSDVFEVGYAYTAAITLYANSQYVFSEDNDFDIFINGNKQMFSWTSSQVPLLYAFPQLANTYFDVWVGGKQVNDINKSDVLGDGGSVSFIKNIFGKYVLILENANITNTGNPDYEFTGYGRGIYSNMSGLTIRVKGNNTIDSKGEGIYFTDNLSISGNSDNQGKLSVKGSYGIRPAKSSTAITLDISRVELTAEGTSGAGIGASTSFSSSSSYNCTMKVGIANTVVKAKGTTVSLGNLNSLVFEDGLDILQPTGASFDGEDVIDASGNIISKQWVVIGKESSIATGIEAAPQIDNGQLTIDNSMPLYNLQGQRVTHPVKGGIYIQNGHKRIIK